MFESALTAVAGGRRAPRTHARGGAHTLRRLGVLGSIVAMLAAAEAPAGLAAAPAVSEPELKAALLYNFARFVEWPAESMSRTDEPFVIGVVGRDPLGEALDVAVAGKKIHDREVVVLRWADADQALPHLRDCQLVFVCRTEAGRFPRLLATLEGGNVLTVADVDGFARRGGVIELFLESSRVRFEINPENAERAGLRVSSKLMGLARITRAAKH